MLKITTEKKQELLGYWNSKKIVVHSRLTPDIQTELSRICKYYSVEEIRGFIDFYTEILEPGTNEKDKKYFWTYKWNFYEFLKRGVKKFDGQTVDNYLRKQKVEAPKAVIFQR